MNVSAENFEGSGESSYNDLALENGQKYLEKTGSCRKFSLNSCFQTVDF